LPSAWDAVVLRLLAKRPEARFDSAEALLGALSALAGRAQAAPAPPSTAPDRPPDAPDSGAPPGQPRILAVDDERDLAEVLEFVLRRAGYETLIAHDGLVAWERVLAERPDMVVLDINMPGLDGYEVLQRIRSLPGPQAATPVIMLTARNDEPSIVAALDAGADDYIAKPFSPRQLLARIRAAMRHAGR
jgi:CheY-like chemotaxis protein